MSDTRETQGEARASKSDWKQTCRWQWQVEPRVWASSCGMATGWKFCPFCGKPLEARMPLLSPPQAPQEEP